ncbi:YcnI family copper-binding membrane protein [Myceligenerans cantabricum]
MNRTAVVRRASLSGLAAAGLVVFGSTSATAHVTITPSTTAAGATAVLRVELPHGCDGSPTTAISIRVPDEATDVSAVGTDRWTVEKAPDGLTYTTDEPLPDGEHDDEIEFSVRLPDEAGAALVFPVVQRCEEGEVAWTEVAEHAESHDTLERPAPVLVVTSAGTEPESTTAAPEPTPTVSAPEPTPATAAPEAASATAGAPERDPLIAYGVTGVLVAGGLTGGALLLRRLRRR